MPLTREQVSLELGTSLDGTPKYSGRETKELYEDKDFIEAIMQEGEYYYHLDILSRNAALYETSNGGGTNYTELQLWGYRFERWNEVATHLRAFVRKLRRLRVHLGETIEEPVEKDLFNKNFAALLVFLEQIDEDKKKQMDSE